MAKNRLSVEQIIQKLNGKLRDELLVREIFDTLWEDKALIERWRPEYNTVRPHSSLERCETRRFGNQGVIKMRSARRK